MCAIRKFLSWKDKIFDIVIVTSNEIQIQAKNMCSAPRFDLQGCW
jgi:hypothetical protein